MSKGSVYDNYDITEIIGEGTYSTVTVATQKRNKEKYAIKIISKEILCTKQKREMVDWEISILSKCSHPHIVDFIEYFESDEDICLVLEWIPNGDLFDRIVKGGVFTEEQARMTMKSILSAVEYLHDKSLVHRDLKPENILFNSEDGDIKLADFGLSKYYDESEGMDTETSGQCGTPMYHAPEIASKKIYRKGVDMWSAGCILYFILFGRPPFYGDDESQIYKLVSQGDWSFPEDNDQQISDEVKDIIKCLLEQDPNKRLTAKDALEHPWILGERHYSPLLHSSLPKSQSNHSISIDLSSSNGSKISISSSNSSQDLSLRSSNTNPIQIKKTSLLRSSLNTSVDLFRFANGTPPTSKS